MILRELDEGDQAAFDRAILEFAASDPSWPFAFGYAPGGDFRAFVARMRQLRDGIDLPANRVAATYLVAVEGDRIVGRASIRHELNAELLERGGHIGFGVVPSARRRGVATEILRRSLELAHSLGVARVLVTCDEDNVGSRTTIEHAGAQLEDIRDHPEGRARRYWF
jgi:predicted acetyltransferase